MTLRTFPRLAWCLGGIALASPAFAADDPSPPPMPASVPASFWNVWVDAKGGTHQTRCSFAAFKPFSLGKGIEDIYVDKLAGAPRAVWIAQFPVGWVGAWHENPKPQWVIPLSGHWFVESTDGTREVMGPGEASYGGDQAAKADAAGHKGHLSGTVGGAPVTLMFVQGADPGPSSTGCRFR